MDLNWVAWNNRGFSFSQISSGFGNYFADHFLVGSSFRNKNTDQAFRFIFGVGFVYILGVGRMIIFSVSFVFFLGVGRIITMGRESWQRQFER